MFRVKSTRRSGKRSPEGSESTVSLLKEGGLKEGRVTEASTITPTNTFAASERSNVTEFFAAEGTATALAKPWLRLDRGLRLQRFRAYAEAYPGLSIVEKAKLYDVLVTANDKKLLNTKQQVNYENGVIQSIRGLKVIRTGDTSEAAVIKIEAPRLTKRNTEDV